MTDPERDALVERLTGLSGGHRATRIAAADQIRRDGDILGPALEACNLIDEAVKSGHDNVSDLILHLLLAAGPARAALAKAGRA